MRYAIVVLALLTLACDRTVDETPTTPNVNVTVIQNQGSNNTGSNPSPSPTNSCSGKPITSTGVSFLDERTSESLSVGETAVLNTTPKDSTGLPVTVPCGAPTEVQGWFAGPLANCEIVGDNRTYTPKLRGKAVGNCDVSVVVMPGVQASAHFIVQ
jgi:hypothetical protein